MNNFHIYKNGQYDTKANLKLKLDMRIEKFQKKAELRLEEIDYYFVNHKKLIR